MKNILLLLAITFSVAISSADAYHSLAVDAVSKFSQIGSKRCTNKSTQVEMISSESKENGPHIEATYNLKLDQKTYRVEIVDGLVTTVTLVSLGNGG